MPGQSDRVVKFKMLFPPLSSYPSADIRRRYIDELVIIIIIVDDHCTDLTSYE